MVQAVQVPNISIHEPPVKLLRDQIVIQIGDRGSTIIIVRTADRKQAACPVEFLRQI